MTHVMPFSCVRVSPDYVSEVTSLPYDFYSDAEAFQYLLDNPKSYMHLDAAGVNFPDEIMSTGKVGYEYAVSLIKKYLKEGIYLVDDEPAYYIYRITTPTGVNNTGIISCIRVDDYFTGHVKKHEATRQKKEDGCKRLMTTLGAQTSPLLLTYPSHGGMSHILDEIKEADKPIYTFVDDFDCVNEVWRVPLGETATRIQDYFKNIDALYIADGHHRAAAAAALGAEEGEKQGSFMALVFPSNEIVIHDYNRALSDLNGLSTQEFINALTECFELEGPLPEAYKPEGKGLFGMYLNNEWYKLSFKPSIENMSPVEMLDVSILQDYILHPILGISDPKTDDRLDFIRGTRGIKALETRKINGEPAAVCFALYPTQVDEFFAVADEGLLMPPKSTWFEPKPRSGILMHRIHQ